MVSSTFQDATELSVSGPSPSSEAKRLNGISDDVKSTDSEVSLFVKVSRVKSSISKVDIFVKSSFFTFCGLVGTYIKLQLTQV